MKTRGSGSGLKASETCWSRVDRAGDEENRGSSASQELMVETES
jgi:hypothetical protein